MASPAPGPLHDLRVVDLSTLIAAPNCARYLADFGATVLKVEHPSGDGLRGLAWRDPRDGEGMWWRLINRNKHTVALDLKDADDLAVLRELLAGADVLVENFRPGTLERLGLDPASLLEANPRLVVTRISGFGQTGPYRDRRGFATVAEAMSGFAAINGEPDGPPLLPPVALTDEVTGVVGAFATMVAVHSGVGQVVDVSLVESLLQLMSPLVSLYGLTGELQQRMGSNLPYSVPRGTYRCADGLWLGLSTSSEPVARRVLGVLGVDGDARFATFADRIAHRDELESVTREWCAQRPREEALRVLIAAEAAVGPVMTVAEICADPHYAARDAVVSADGFPMQGLIAKLAATPGAVRWAGRPLDADGEAVRAGGWDALRDAAPD